MGLFKKKNQPERAPEPEKKSPRRESKSAGGPTRPKGGNPPQGIGSAGGSTRPKGGNPPAGNQIRRRHLVRPTGRRERAISLPPQGR